MYNAQTFTFGRPNLIREDAVGEEWLNQLDPGLRILCFASMLRVFTLGQAARYAWNGDAIVARQALERAVGQQRSLNILRNFQLPKACGGDITDVYFLTLSGINVVKKIAPQLARYARKQPPRGALRSRIPHDLLITESYLWIHKRFVILEFIPEESLKAQLRRDGGRRSESGDISASNEATGDFKVCVIKRGEESDARWVECEVSLHLDADQIGNKPEGMAWFTSSRQQADMIETVCNRRPIILASVTRPGLVKGRNDVTAMPLNVCRRGDESAPSVQLKQDAGTLTEAHERVLNALDLLGGCATAEAIAGVFQCGRSGISRSLNELEAVGKLRREDVQFRPGRERGRPKGLYVAACTKPLPLGARLHRLMLSQVVVASTRCSFSVQSYNAERGALEFRHMTCLNEPPMVFVIDDPQVEVEEIKKRLATTRLRFFRECGTVVVAMVSEERMTKLHKLDRWAKIYDVSQRLIEK